MKKGIMGTSATSDLLLSKDGNEAHINSNTGSVLVIFFPIIEKTIDIAKIKRLKPKKLLSIKNMVDRIESDP